ncbi:MAG TPA: hypothetical protein VJH65_03480 [Candidatus Nanoarchaeia archaeon]|nr:hypothetical protein [Candidatus Nanoarchaeia archaeon]
MCFTPVISLSTAILEFFVATFIFIYFKKSRVNFFFIIFLYFLGFYQFSEFMLCTSGSAFFWAKIGFVTYTFLPAIGLYSVLRIINRDYKSYKLALVYLLPIIFSLIAIFSNNFIIKGECNKFFVEVQTMFSLFPILRAFYVIYYFGFLLLICIFLLSKIVKEKNKIKKKIEIVIFVAIILNLFPVIILMSIIPALGIMFPSIYCEFAVLFAIAAVIAAYLDSKPRKRY